MSNHTIPSAFLKSVLQNGVGRYVCQLQRITFRFCKASGCSKGMRHFIETDVIDFAKKNPGVVVYLKPRRHRGPSLYAEYLNGNVEVIKCRDFSKEEIGKWLEFLRTRSGVPLARLRKFWHTDSPSIQGVWTPFTHKPNDINVTNFPNEELSRVNIFLPSATEQLLEIARNSSLQENSYVLENKEGDTELMAKLDA